MSLLTVQRRMLYCPKCNRTYEEGSQRFCSDDSVRLLPKSELPRSVFSNLYARPPQTPGGGAEDREDDGAAAAAPPPPPPFARPGTRKRIFEPVEAFNPDKNIGAGRNEPPPAAQAPPPPAPDGKPQPRLIRPNEIPPSQAKLGDRRAEPGGGRSQPLTWENTEILLGQTVKGRYRIAERLGEDETSVAYLAEDKIVAGKKVVVRVLMDEPGGADDESGKIYAEERVSLSHLNHPNIASLLDSGSLPEGKNFIVAEYVEGVSLRDMLRQAGTFNPLRAGRVVRQIADALSEAHVNGILHRGLRPEHIVLTVSESGKELVKVTNFGVYDGFEEPTEQTVKYLAPEQLEGKLPSYASDIYSLAVTAYQMLTGRLPFNFPTAKELLRAQKEGLSLRPTNLRLDLPPQIDDILEKALSLKPADRYPKARDFGDNFYNALTSAAPWEQPASAAPPAAAGPPAEQEKPEAFYGGPLAAQNAAAKAEEKTPPAVKTETTEDRPQGQRTTPREVIPSAAPPAGMPPPLKLVEADSPSRAETPPVESENIAPEEEKETAAAARKEITEPAVVKTAAAAAPVAPVAEPNKTGESKETRTSKATAAPAASQDLPWEKRSPEPLKEASTSRVFLLALGVLLLGLGAWAVWNYFANRPAEPVYVATNTAQNAAAPAGANNGGAPAAENPAAAGPPQSAEPPPAEIEAPPLPRKVDQPPNTVYFQTSKENVKGDLARNFRGFSVFYPDDWTKNPSETHFIDVARVGATGTPIEQFLVTYYESRGTFGADRENFPNLVEKSSRDLKEALGGIYTLVWHGETRINGDWKAYEMKFQREGVTKNGDKITLWGRRLWIPAARPGERSGFVVTLLATSLSPEVKSVNDVGVKGELAQVLETFEPTSLDAAF